ncbi:MAG: DNA mismatch repair protein MutS, partial [Rhodobiaceae bacterium]|nr:DNA mismatch repair protein MutS [Rhodobiaceae bacterium]
GQPPLDRLVIAYEPAAAAHGGDGALYLRLRAKSGARG